MSDVTQSAEKDAPIIHERGCGWETGPHCTCGRDPERSAERDALLAIVHDALIERTTDYPWADEASEHVVARLLAAGIRVIPSGGDES